MTLPQLTPSPSARFLEKADSPLAAVLQLVNDWRASLDLLVSAGELSPASSDHYQRGMDRFLAFCQQSHVPHVSPDALRSWKAALLAAGMRPNSVNSWMSGVRAFFRWAVGQSRLLENPALDLRSARREASGKKHLREPLTRIEIRRVLDLPNPADPQGARDRAILYTMAYTGARTVELHRADLHHLRTEGGRLVLSVQGKGHTQADDLIVIAHPAAEEALYDWLAVRGQAPGPLFTSLSNRTLGKRLSLNAFRHIIKSYFRLAGVRGDRKTAHSLRHTAITTAIQNGATVQKVRSMARHASIDTTMIYFHEVDRLENPAEGFINYDE